MSAPSAKAWAAAQAYGAGPRITIERTAADRRLARVDGEEALPFRVDDAGAWVEAKTLGRWLQMSRDRDARALAKSLKKQKILNDFEIRGVRSQTPGTIGRPPTEQWMSRSGALKFAAHSGTERGAKLFDLVMKIFLAVIDGHILGGEITDEQIEAEVRYRVEACIKSATLPRPNIEEWSRTFIRAPLRDLSRRLAAIEPEFSQRSHTGKLHKELADALDIPRDMRWPELPTARLGDAAAWIAQRARQVRKREDRLRAECVQILLRLDGKPAP